MEETKLKELVRAMVEELLEEATTRDGYIERVFDAAKGAMGEHFKARYAEENARLRLKAGPGTQQGWDREVDKLLRFGFRNAVDRTVHGDKRKAFEAAMEQLRRMVPRYLEWARGEVAEAFGVDEDHMEDPPDSATDEFFARLENEFDAVVTSSPPVGLK